MPSPRKAPPRKTRLAVQSSHRRGRPPIENFWTLLEIWLFVQENGHRTLKSVNAICDECTFEFWVLRSDRPLLRRLTGASLKRRYYEAEALLRKETEEFEENRDALVRLGATVSCTLTEPRLVTYVNDELKRRMQAN